MQSLTMNKASASMARPAARRTVVCRAEMKPTRIAGAALASVAAATLLSSSAMAIGLPGFDPAALQERSDATFQEINSSTSKTGNSDPANQMRPDLQRDTLLPSEGTKDAAKAGLKSVTNKITNAADKAVDKVTPGSVQSSIGNNPGAIKSFLDNNARRSDAVSDEALQKTKDVFNSFGLNKNSS